MNRQQKNARVLVVLGHILIQRGFCIHLLPPLLLFLAKSHLNCKFWIKFVITPY
jgi:hypothetical protein